MDNNNDNSDNKDSPTPIETKEPTKKKRKSVDRGECKGLHRGSKAWYKAKGLTPPTKPGPYSPRNMTREGILKRNANLIPGGVAGIPKNIRDMMIEVGNQKELADKYAPAILASLVDLAMNCPNMTVRSSTAMYLADRVYGKAIQPLVVEGNINMNIGVIYLPPKPEIKDIDIIDLDSEPTKDNDATQEE